MTHLSVNVNKVALLRNARHWDYPSVTHAAQVALHAGAKGITAHPRPDQRHIRTQDIHDLADLLKEPRWHDRELNLEGNPFLGHYMDLVRAVKPTQATLVPDSNDQSTSDHGFLLRDPRVVASLKPIVEELRGLGIRVSVFVDPEPGLMEHAKYTSTDRVELYTQPFAEAFSTVHQTHTLNRFSAAAARANELGLGLNAGHDLTLDNLKPFLQTPHILEVSIGQALIADAVFMGLDSAVRAYLKACA